MARLTPTSAYKAVRFLADKIYEFDKKYDFEVPNSSIVLLEEYVTELRWIVDEVIRISRAPVMRPIDFKKRLKEVKKKKKEFLKEQKKANKKKKNGAKDAKKEK